jgi:hypothetical protein
MAVPLRLSLRVSGHNVPWARWATMGTWLVLVESIWTVFGGVVVDVDMAEPSTLYVKILRQLLFQHSFS